ncbi:MAG TPA: universal stress protein [Candidatus Binatia bacterium]|jgi:nucleotide-binding universal stress UspA family protein
MNEIKKILAPTDLSTFSAKGFVYAAHLAKALGAQVVVCHVVRTEEFVGHARLLEKALTTAKVEEQLGHLRDSHRELLHGFIKRHLPASAKGVVVKEIVEMGEPDDLIVNWANDNSIDVIVISTHGRSGLPRMILGSVTEKVLRKARCPVLAIPCHEE